jgi:hypothetical protein
MSDNIHIEDADFEETQPTEPTEDSIEDPVYYPDEISDDILSQLVNLGGNDIYHEPTCCICSSPYRKAVEEKWFETKSYDDVRGILKNSKIKNISDDIIKNHIQYHFEKGIVEIKKKEYVERIKRLQGQNTLSSLDRINFALSVISERLVSLNALVPTDDFPIAEVEKIKTGETKKLMDTYSKYLKMQADLMGEMQNAGEMIQIPQKLFIEFFNDLLSKSETTDLEKEIILKIVSGLKGLSKN